MIQRMFFLLLALCVEQMLSAKIWLPSILGDNMVLQQHAEVCLWGKTDKRGQVRVCTSWDNAAYTAAVAADGKWKVKLCTPKAGGPYTVTLDDGEKLELTNVLIGEVWFCSGQSNMEMPMRGFDRQPVKGANDVIARAKPSVPIRIFNADSQNGARILQYSKVPQEDCQGKWHVNSPENVAEVSATAYHFARYLQEVMEVPVGIIVSTFGGSRIETWMSREAIAAFPSIQTSILDSQEPVKNVGATPTILYNAKIAPFFNFAIKGMLWYQGESNRKEADLYRQLMPAFVKDLRGRWGRGEFPVYFVEIAPYNYEGAEGTSAAYMREVQLQNMKDISHCGMVTTLDIGHPSFIHPVDKEMVGTRLAWWALADTYGYKGFGYAAPVYKSMEIVDNKIYINVDHAKYGLSPMLTALNGFEIAGEDRIFYPAFAEIETKTCRLAVSSDKVPHPVAVRYAYKNYAEASVFSVYGLPLVAFRTDTWKDDTVRYAKDVN